MYKYLFQSLLLITEFWEFFMYYEYKTFIRNTIHKHFFLVCAFSFYFLNVFQREEVLSFDLVQFIIVGFRAKKFLPNLRSQWLGNFSRFFFFFFFSPCKKLYCSHLVQSLGEGSRVVKMMPSGCRERLQAEALTTEGLLKGRWAPEALSRAWGWGLKRNSPSPTWGPG